AREFAARRFDWRFLIRAVTASRAYQLSSAADPGGRNDPRLFARMALKGLSPEQLYDSVAQATGFHEGPPADPRLAFLNDRSPRGAFLARFADHGGTTTEFQLSALQALTLMNSKLIAAAISLEQGETLSAVLDSPFLDTAGRIETLYLAALARRPTPQEQARLVQYVKGGAADDDQGKGTDQALADVFWALLNSAEFITNH